MEHVQKMKSPSTFGAVPVPVQLSELEWVQDLEYYDGPLLSHFKGKSGEDVMTHWVDCDGECNRWLYYVTDHLGDYVSGKISLKKLLDQCVGSVVLVVDIDAACVFQSVWAVNVSSLPADYLPDDENVDQETKE